MHRSFRSLLAVAAAGGLCLAGGAAALAAPAFGAAAPQVATGGSTATPIRHLVVIFQENVSFDHYFGTYPQRSEEHTSELQSQSNLVCRLLLEKKNRSTRTTRPTVQLSRMP